LAKGENVPTQNKIKVFDFLKEKCRALAQSEIKNAVNSEV